jgi:cytochrome d ubiquinol oxidase subunit I
MDATFLARLQFALTAGFHFLFPPVSIGLAWMLVYVEHRAWRTGDEVWVRAGKYFGKLFALTFAVGVATGIVLEFQFGTNWSRYSRFVGDIFGAPLAAEGVFAFFLESGFLGLYLFGRDRVSKGVHWLAILMVALGATLSAFWIIVANSWQQTPAGFVLNPATGRAELTSFAQAVWNPSTVVRYTHTVVAALVAGAFFMAGVSAYLLLRQRGQEVAGRTLKVALGALLVAAVLVIFPTGHEHARQVARTQPEKFAAIEGLYTTERGAPLVLFAVPKARPPGLRGKIEVPRLLSWMAFGDPQAEIKGLDQFPKRDLPPLWLTFVSFHNMVALGLLFVAVAALGVFLWWRGRLLGARWYLWTVFVVSPLPLVACQFGWVTAEVGRQPWVVYKLLRTADATSPRVAAGEILASIILFTLIYLALLALYLFLLYRELKHGPPPAGAGAAPAGPEVR